jgi:hypothetical protein
MWVNFRCKFLVEVGQFYAPINTYLYSCVMDEHSVGLRLSASNYP